MKPKKKTSEQISAAVIDDETETVAQPSRIKPKDFPHHLEQFEDKLIQMGMEFDKLERDAYPRVAKIIEGAVPELEKKVFQMVRAHSDRIEFAILRQLFEFLKSEPIWETRFVPGLQAQRHEVELLYRQGWRYIMSCHDQKSGIGGMMYIRPKLPKTFEEFRAIYETVLLEMKKKDADLTRREDYYAQKKKKEANRQAAIEADEAQPVLEAEVVDQPVKKMLVKPKVKLMLKK